mmetsp:Transcript_60488/g.194769  ORF Transcript_60488/g.194769 Transcript_60488/m.194769 type:complete len:298 (-) Transcript_60488:190-1083(-)
MMSESSLRLQRELDLTIQASEMLKHLNAAPDPAHRCKQHKDVPNLVAVTEEVKATWPVLLWPPVDEEPSASSVAPEHCGQVRHYASNILSRRYAEEVDSWDDAKSSTTNEMAREVNEARPQERSCKRQRDAGCISKIELPEAGPTFVAQCYSGEVRHDNQGDDACQVHPVRAVLHGWPRAKAQVVGEGTDKTESRRDHQSKDPKQVPLQVLAVSHCDLLEELGKDDNEVTKSQEVRPHVARLIVQGKYSPEEAKQPCRCRAVTMHNEWHLLVHRHITRGEQIARARTPSLCARGQLP